MKDLAPRHYSESQIALIRKTVAKDTAKDEFDLFIEICKQQGLDPFKKQIYAQVYNKYDPDKRQMVIVTSIDGYRAKAQRCSDYRPAEDATVYETDASLIDVSKNPAGLIRAIVKVFKYGPDKKWYPVVGEARWDEFAPLEYSEYKYVPTGDYWPDGKPKNRRVPIGDRVLKEGNWKTMPYVMLGKCAEAQALRRGWPEDMSGLYVQEEMARVQIDMSASEIADAFEEEQRLKAISGNNTVPAIFEMTEGLQLIPVGKFADRCIEHARTISDPVTFDMWRDQNTHGLRQFWAYSPNDALDLKKTLETIRASFATSESAA